jgi:hypothetical protein
MYNIEMDLEAEPIEAILNTTIHLSPLIQDTEYQEEHSTLHDDATEANDRFVTEKRAESAMLRYLRDRFGDSFSIRIIQNDYKNLVVQLAKCCMKQGIKMNKALQVAQAFIHELCQEQVATFLLSLQVEQQECLIDRLGLRLQLEAERKQAAEFADGFDAAFFEDGLTDEDFERDAMEIAPIVREMHRDTTRETGLTRGDRASKAALTGELEAAIMYTIVDRVEEVLKK